MSTKPQNDNATNQEQESRFTLDHELLEKQGRSAGRVLESRMCPACRAKLKASQKPQEMQFKEMRALIRQHCQNDLDYLDPQLPVLEITFRLMLLASPTEPAPLSKLHEQIAQVWNRSPWPRYISPQTLQRVLAHDTYYGIVGVLPTGKEKEG